MNTCTTCKGPLAIPAVGEEEQRVFCEGCGITTIVAGRRQVREAGARMANEEDQARGYRMPMFNLELQGRHVGETDDAFRRRIAIRQGLDPDAAPPNGPAEEPK